MFAATVRTHEETQERRCIVAPLAGVASLADLRTLRRWALLFPALAFTLAFAPAPALAFGRGAALAGFVGRRVCRGAGLARRSRRLLLPLGGFIA
jgi:hypothetical protein